MAKYGKKVKSTRVKREKGMLYYVKGDPLEIWASPMKGRTKR
jgi:hypothetical protein